MFIHTTAVFNLIKCSIYLQCYLSWTPYIIDSDPSTPRVSTSTLAFMDDTTLISSSTEGLLHLLDIAQEFYNMNNTKINFNKAELICNRDPTNHTSPIPDHPVPYNFKTSAIDFTCPPL